MRRGAGWAPHCHRRGVAPRRPFQRRCRWQLRMSRLSGKIPRITMSAGASCAIRELARVFHLVEEDWRLIEEKYGRQIPDEARSDIIAATYEFLRLAYAEGIAPSKADALERLEKLESQTESLQKAINELPVDNPIREYVDEEIAFAYSISKYEDSTPILEYLSTFERELERFSKSCRDIITFLSSHDFWPAGGAWGIWIRQLIRILDHYHLPTSARKDTDKAKSDKASQFVELVDALQRLIPQLFRQSNHSKPALANAIHKARKYSKPLTRKRQSSGSQ